MTVLTLSPSITTCDGSVAILLLSSAVHSLLVEFEPNAPPPFLCLGEFPGDAVWALCGNLDSSRAILCCILVYLFIRNISICLRVVHLVVWGMVFFVPGDHTYLLFKGRT